MTRYLSLRFVALAALTAVVVSVFGSSGTYGPGIAHAAVNCDVGDTSIDGEEQAFLGLINGYRGQAGAAALVITGPLTRAAVWHSNDQAAGNYFGHTDSLGRDPFMRMADCDVPGSDNAAENVAAGTAGAQAAFDIWRNSAGHNVNMLNSTYRGIGIARVFRAGTTYSWYWTTVFSVDASGGGAPAGGPPAGAPAPAPAPVQAPAAPAGCSAVSLASNQPPSVVRNTRVTLTASPICPGGTATLQWWGAFVFPNGDQLWQEITAYGAPRSYIWTPTAPGNYILGVWAKTPGANPPSGFEISAMTQITVR